MQCQPYQAVNALRTLDVLPTVGRRMVDAPQPGERVKIEVASHNGMTEMHGVVLHPAAPRHITLKLVNGYNASYPLESIESLEVLGQMDAPVTGVAAPVTASNELPRVRILHTGGTIASKVDYATGAVVARFEPEELLASLPELNSIANIEAVKLGNMFSDDIRPQHWNAIAEASKKAFDDGCRGVVVTHGTDTLHISSAAVGLAWAGRGGTAPGPIAFVGSQRSSDRGSSDAAENLLCAVHWAANGPQPLGSMSDTTVVIMHANANDGVCAVLPGTGARKMHTSRRDAFHAINCEPLGQVHIQDGNISHTIEMEYSEALETQTQREVAMRPDTYETGVRIAQFTAGPWLHAEHIEAVAQTGIQAIIIHGTGLGHLPIDDPGKDAPENTKIWRTLTRCVNREIPIVVTSQCISGPIDMNVYSKGRKQIDMGLLGHGSVASPETVIVKVHWALSNSMTVAEAIASDLAGEGRNTLRN
jgi:glutamyl-tRNA(Gln) amidotransferase subunit D